MLFYSLICRALFSWVLRLLVARITAFRDYSVFFVDDGTTCSSFVETWDKHELFCVCVLVESSGQKVPVAELAGLSHVVDSTMSCQFSVSCRGGSPSLLQVLSDNRVDGRQFIVCQEFSEETILQCFREAHQEVLGMLEVTSMVDFLVLRLRGHSRNLGWRTCQLCVGVLSRDQCLSLIYVVL